MVAVDLVNQAPLVRMFAYSYLQGGRLHSAQVPIKNRAVLSCIGFAEFFQESIGRYPALRAQFLSPSHVQHGFPHVQIPLIELGTCVKDTDSTLCMNLHSFEIWTGALADCSK